MSKSERVNKFKGSIILTQWDIDALSKDGYTHIAVGTWGDGTPAFAKLEREMHVGVTPSAPQTIQEPIK